MLQSFTLYFIPSACLFGEACIWFHAGAHTGLGAHVEMQPVRGHCLQEADEAHRGGEILFRFEIYSVQGFLYMGFPETGCPDADPVSQ